MAPPSGARWDREAWSGIERARDPPCPNPKRCMAAGVKLCFLMRMSKMTLAMISDDLVRGESGSISPEELSIWRSSDQCAPGPTGNGSGKGGCKVIVTASGRFKAFAKLEKLAEVSPRPGRKRIA